MSKLLTLNYINIMNLCNLEDYYRNVSVHSNPIFANINGLTIIKKLKNL